MSINSCYRKDHSEVSDIILKGDFEHKVPPDVSIHNSIPTEIEKVMFRTALHIYDNTEYI